MPDTDTYSSDLHDDMKELWRDLKNGDRLALNALFRTYYGALFNFGLRLVGSEEAVKDAIQQLFLKLWNKRDAISIPNSTKSYLFVALRRIMLDNKERDRARKKRNHEFFDSTYTLPGTVEEQIIADETDEYYKKMLFQALQHLTDREKEALHLRFYDGFANEEIAKIMGINNQSVRNYLSEGIQKIQQITATTSFSDSM